MKRPKPSETALAVRSPDAERAINEAGGDGRKLRSVRSRQRIIDALFRLIRGGDPAPTVAKIAEEANVSLRTTFRHIDDMDSLMREMGVRTEAEVRPILDAPYGSKNWREQMNELIDRRAIVFEHVWPIKLAASLRRFRSAYLMAQYEYFLAGEREGLAEVLPAKIRRQKTKYSALLLALSFEGWRRLRQDEGLSARQTKAAVRLLVDSILADET
ncbi:MAG: TetR/AcrR family transcriptional regulator [Pseudomonadota bacterium]